MSQVLDKLIESIFFFPAYFMKKPDIVVAVGVQMVAMPLMLAAVYRFSGLAARISGWKFVLAFWLLLLGLIFVHAFTDTGRSGAGASLFLIGPMLVALPVYLAVFSLFDWLLRTSFPRTDRPRSE